MNPEKEIEKLSEVADRLEERADRLEAELTHVDDKEERYAMRLQIAGLYQNIAGLRNQLIDRHEARRVNTPPNLTTQQVFIVGLGHGCSPNMNMQLDDLLGTCFAVTKKHVLTARHVLCEADLVTLLVNETQDEHDKTTFVIFRRCTKAGSSASIPLPMKVKLVHSNVEHDWAMLELTETQFEFPAWFTLCPKPELPQLDTETVDLKAFIAPIGNFKKSPIYDLQIWTDDYHRVLQYDKNDTHIIVDGGLYRGTCGSPYVNRRGKVVAMHLESENEGENVSLVKPLPSKRRKESSLELTETLCKVIDHVSDLSSVYASDVASTRIGVVLSNVPDLIGLIDAENVKA